MRHLFGTVGLTLVVALLPCNFLVAQSSQPSSRAAEAEMIQLNFPASVEVKVLVEYVSKRLNLNIVYDDSVGAKKVTIHSPAKIPKESLLPLLQSVLKMANLAMVDGDQANWKKIVQSQNLIAATGVIRKDPLQLLAAGETAVTQIFEICNVGASSVEPVIKPFLSQPGGNCFCINDRGMLVVTDFASNLRRVSALIEVMDRPAAKTAIKFLPARHVDAADLARQATTLLAEKDRLSGAARPIAKVAISSEPRTNQVVLIAADGNDEEAIKLIESLDVATTAATKTYRLKHVSPQRIDKLAQDFVGGEPGRKSYKSTVDAESGLLIVTASETTHRHVADLLRDLDIPGDPTTSHVRFYKLMNTTAAQVLATIRSLDAGASGLAALDKAPAGVPRDSFTGPNLPPAAPAEEPPKPPSYRPASSGSTQPAEPPGSDGNAAVRTKDAVVTADANTNTIIVIAPPGVQNTYKQLIAILDKRRPQVMIEVTLVTLDTSKGFSLGVEVSRKDTCGDNQTLAFSAFGLSTINPVTGSLTAAPSTGFNGVLLSPDAVNVVIKALASNAHARVLSAPKVLINDNATATLSSIAEAPFTSINASQTVSTTSFAGYASAGTTVTATPHISEGDHLQLQYAVTLNSFTGQGSAGIPPPRQTNSINSEVTIPDGYAVVVGGLSRKDFAHTVAKVPLLGDIPLIKHAFSSMSITDAQSTLFVFIRPVILRDDQFEDLKYLTDVDLHAAQLPPNLPASEPIVMR